MKKKELLRLSDWHPSAETVELAQKDVPELKRLPYINQVKYFFKYDIYMEAIVSGDVLAVSLFEAEALRVGSTKPVYITFFVQDSEWFLTYDAVAEKWRSAMLMNLPHIRYGTSVYVNNETQQRVAAFLHIVNGDYEGLSCYQQSIRERQVHARHKKVTSLWEEQMKLVPALPKDWPNWLNRTAITNHFIFYTYSRKVTEGYCTRCGRMVPVTKARYNKLGRCPRCRCRIQYKSVAKSGYLESPKQYAYLIQPYGKDGRIVIREFD